MRQAPINFDCGVYKTYTRRLYIYIYIYFVVADFQTHEGHKSGRIHDLHTKRNEKTPAVLQQANRQSRRLEHTQQAAATTARKQENAISVARQHPATLKKLPLRWQQAENQPTHGAKALDEGQKRRCHTDPHRLCPASTAA